MSSTQRTAPGFGGIAWGALAFLYTPIVILIVFSFNSSKLITVWEGFSADWYRIALENDDLRRAAVNSLIVGLGAMVFSTLIALSTAIAMHRRKAFRGKQLINSLIMLPLMVPEVVIAIASSSFFTAISLSLGIANVLIAHVVFCIPFAYLPMRARLETIPVRALEAAADLYADPWRAFYYVTVPLLMPGIFSGALLAFITSLDDFIITQMVAPPGAMTLPVYIYSMVRRGITPEINAISAILLTLSMIFVIISYLINQKKVA
ncbi:MAG: ABC transporter permease [Proteobacteria bacterium]|nr:ABC transporter permease [Pseudomonadota bacterium]